jgi:hypothetical protein
VVVRLVCTSRHRSFGGQPAPHGRRAVTERSTRTCIFSKGTRVSGSRLCTKPARKLGCPINRPIEDPDAHLHQRADAKTNPRHL